MFSVFERSKVTINENVNFPDIASGMQLLGCSTLVINWKNDNDVTSFRHDIIVRNFCGSHFYLVKFTYWSKIHVNIITCFGVMTIFVYKRLKRNLQKLEIHPPEFCSISAACGKLWIPSLAWTCLIKSY